MGGWVDKKEGGGDEMGTIKPITGKYAMGKESRGNPIRTVNPLVCPCDVQ